MSESRSNHAVDPHLSQKQNDWGDIFDNKALLSDPELKQIDPTYDGKELVLNMRQRLRKDQISNLSRVWFDTAIHSVHIRIPQNVVEFNAYVLYEKSWWGWIIWVSAWVLIIGPFVAQPFCSYTVNFHNVNADDGFHGSGGPGIPIGLLTGPLDINL